MRDLFSGDRIRLTAIKETDLGWIENWFNDIEFLRYYDVLPAIPQTQNDVKKVIEHFTNSKDRYMFAIRLKNTEQIIGIIGFDDIIWTNSVATLHIGIGDEKYTGKGVGREALDLLLDFGFNELNFHRIQLNVISYNEGAIKSYEKKGFTREGTYREFVFRDGKRFDMYLYGLLKSEWIKVK